jgi:DNA-binding IclR family transcriptional regulator
MVRRTNARATSETQSVVRALSLMGCFSLREPELSVTELARRLGIHKSTVSRLLATLETQGFVRQDAETSKYSLGYRVLELASFVVRRLDVRQIAHPHLVDLARRCQETVNLAIFDGAEALNVDEVLSTHGIQYVGWIGRRTPAHCSSTGKALLAFQTPETIERVLAAPLMRYTDRTSVDSNNVRRELQRVREQGYATADEEFQQGLFAVAAPIVAEDGSAVAAISVSAPRFRATASRRAVFARLVCEAAEQVAASLAPPTLLSLSIQPDELPPVGAGSPSTRQRRIARR